MIQVSVGSVKCEAFAVALNSPGDTGTTQGESLGSLRCHIASGGKIRLDPNHNGAAAYTSIVSQTSQRQ